MYNVALLRPDIWYKANTRVPSRNLMYRRLFPGSTHLICGCSRLVSYQLLDLNDTGHVQPSSTGEWQAIQRSLAVDAIFVVAMQDGNHAASSYFGAMVPINV